MKIVQAVGWYFPEGVSGTEVYVAGLSHRLKAAGHEVSIASPLSGLSSARIYEHQKIPVFRYPIPTEPSRAECQGRCIVRGAELFHQWLRQERADWVHFHTFSTGLGIAEVEAARTAGARVLATNHLASLGFICQRGTLMRWGESLCDGVCEPVKCAECELNHRGLPRVAASLLARVTNVPMPEFPGPIGSALSMPNLIRRNLQTQHRLFALLEWFVVLNQWAADAVVANGAPPEKVVLNRLGVSYRAPNGAALRTSRAPDAPVKIGYFGRIVELKGVVELAKAFASLPKDANATLEFRGPAEGDAAQALIGQLREIVKGDKRVIFSPPVSAMEAPQILANYDVLCIPSIWFENGPTVMMEAHAVGTPVIGTRIGAMAEIIRDKVNGRLVPPRDVAALAAALQEVVSNPSETINCWRRALPPTRTMDDIAADYLRLYET
ncbi:MAG: glycosyltransferase [Bryobacteraceae bacterium]